MRQLRKNMILPYFFEPKSRPHHTHPRVQIENGRHSPKVV